MTTKEIIEEELTPEQIQQDADEKYEAGFAKVSGDEPEAEKEPEKEDIKEEAVPEKEVKEEVDEFKEDPPDEWAGVPEAIRKRIETLEKVPDRLRNIEGRFGGLNSTVINLSKTAAQKQGVVSPSKAEIDEASQDEAKWTKLMEDNPDWADIFTTQASVTEKRILQKIPKVDQDAIRNELRAEYQQNTVESSKSLRELIKLDTKHSDWEETINTDDFKAFVVEGGPPIEDYLRNVALSRTSPAEADKELNDWIKTYPNWWADKGSKAYSNSAKDGIALLDLYSQKSETEHKEAPADSRRNTQRLAAATIPKGTQTPTQKGLSEDDAYEEGFKKHARK